jgi:tetratricopeptide (TPR) repeat protein
MVDKSILNISRDGRYEMHELQRQYAEERLKGAPALQTVVRDRHCAYFCEFMRKPLTEMLGPGNKVTLQEMEAEIGNVRAAWSWAVEHKQVRNLKKAMTGIYWFAWLRSWHEEGERAFRHAVEALRNTEPDVESEIALGQALSNLGAMCIWLGRSRQASEYLHESVSILRRLDAREELARALGAQGWLATTQQEWTDAKPLLLEAAAMFEETRQQEFYGFILGLLGRVADKLGEHEESENYHQQALLLGRRVGDQRTIADALFA